MAMTMIAIARAAGPVASVPVRRIVDIADTLTDDANQKHIRFSRRRTAGPEARERDRRPTMDLLPAMAVKGPGEDFLG
jgi:hypothetical protein